MHHYVNLHITIGHGEKQQMKITETINEPIFTPLDGEDLFKEFLKMTKHFHGYPAPGVILGCYMVELAKTQVPDGILYDAICETSWCLPDAVQMLTPCTTGNGWLKILNLGLYAVSLYDKFTGEGVRIFLDGRKLLEFDEISNWLLKRKPKAEQNSERLRQQIREKHHLICSRETVKISPEHLVKRSKGPVSICRLCHEAYPSRHGDICRQCQGDSPYLDRKIQKTKDLDGPLLKSVNVEDAVGEKILHDMTRIIPGQYKGAAFRRGQIIMGGDVCRLQQMGRNRLYLENSDINSNIWVHENQAAEAFANAMAGEGTRPEGPPREGKVNIVAEQNGLLLIDTRRLYNFNLIPNVMAASRKNYAIIKKNKRIAGTRAIPLYLSKDLFNAAMAILETKPLFTVRPFKPAKIGILITGTEIFQGLVKDKFEPIITGKVLQYGCSSIIKTIIAPDDRGAISETIGNLIDAGSEIIITTAGLSVDPEDLTLKGLMDAGAKDLLHGAAVLPGAMTLLGKIKNTRLIGVPACALFHKTTSFDLLFPRILAGVNISREDLAELAHGGLCLECRTCSYPKCPFGK
jgi:formylmethanofuran dehydrogenase subunit E